MWGNNIFFNEQDRMFMIKHQLDAAQTAQSRRPSAGLQLKSLPDTVAPATPCLRPPATGGHKAQSAPWRKMTTWTIFTSRYYRRT